MQFIHQPLTYGFLIVLVPLLIHLINMMRHRRVKWAAMEFLLQSYKKHRKWIWLKQLILLLMRMAAIALIVAMLAQLVTRDQWVAMFGGKTTHHYILLDDSYSMTERLGGASAFEKALRVVSQIGERAKNSDTQQKMTLIRFSLAAGAPASADDEAAIEQIADLNAEIVDANFDILFEEKKSTINVTQLATGPGPALEIVKQLVEKNEDENHVG